MPKGGARAGSGRKAGSANKKTREIANAACESGITPLEYMLQLMRDESQPVAIRSEMAKAAAPYVHPRLASVELAGKNGAPMETLTRIEMVPVRPRGDSPA